MAKENMSHHQSFRKPFRNCSIIKSTTRKRYGFQPLQVIINISSPATPLHQATWKVEHKEELYSQLVCELDCNCKNFLHATKFSNKGIQFKVSKFRKTTDKLEFQGYYVKTKSLTCDHEYAAEKLQLFYEVKLTHRYLRHKETILRQFCRLRMTSQVVILYQSTRVGKKRKGIVVYTSKMYPRCENAVNINNMNNFWHNRKVRKMHTTIRSMSVERDQGELTVRV